MTLTSNSPDKNLQMDRSNNKAWHENEETTQLLPRRNPNTANNSQQNNPYNNPNDDHHPLALADLATILKPGRNDARFILIEKQTLVSIATCSIYSWSTEDRVVIMDVDGSITKSNVRGLFDTLVTEEYSYCHHGVCHFLTNLIQKTTTPLRGDLRILYLTSRPIALSPSTRKFLTRVRQPSTNEPNKANTLPEGPLIGFPGTIAQILPMELIYHSVHDFKHQSLVDNVLKPWARLGRTELPFWAALGNTSMDVQAYHAAGIPLSRMGFITKQSTIHVLRSPHSHSTTTTKTTPELDSEHSFLGFMDADLLGYFQRIDELSVDGRNA